MADRPHSAPIEFDLTGDDGRVSTSALSADTPVQHEAPSPRLREHAPPEVDRGVRRRGDVDSAGRDDDNDDADNHEHAPDTPTSGGLRPAAGDRWVAHRRTGWTVESPGRGEPVSTHESFTEAHAALGEHEGANTSREDEDGGYHDEH